MNENRKIRMLVAKPGLDGHERGAQVIALGLRDEGFEVIFTGLRQSPDQIVRAAIQEDVDVVGLSILSGAHIQITKKIMARLHEREADDMMVLVGGVIPEKDIPTLKDLGVAQVFTAGSSIKEIADFIRSRLS